MNTHARAAPILIASLLFLLVWAKQCQSLSLSTKTEFNTHKNMLLHLKSGYLNTTHCDSGT
jgi:hypothetical protein